MPVPSKQLFHNGSSHEGISEDILLERLAHVEPRFRDEEILFAETYAREGGVEVLNVSSAQKRFVPVTLVITNHRLVTFVRDPALIDHALQRTSDNTHPPGENSNPNLFHSASRASTKKLLATALLSKSCNTSPPLTSTLTRLKRPSLCTIEDAVAPTSQSLVSQLFVAQVIPRSAISLLIVSTSADNTIVIKVENQRVELASAVTPHHANSTPESPQLQFQYWGPTSAGVPHGRGDGKYADGSLYSGEWKNGFRDGHGVFRDIDGSVYKGAWLNDRKHGVGVLQHPNGVAQEGEWMNGKRVPCCASCKTQLGFLKFKLPKLCSGCCQEFCSSCAPERNVRYFFPSLIQMSANAAHRPQSSRQRCCFQCFVRHPLLPPQDVVLKSRHHWEILSVLQYLQQTPPAVQCAADNLCCTNCISLGQPSGPLAVEFRLRFGKQAPDESSDFCIETVVDAATNPLERWASFKPHELNAQLITSRAISRNEKMNLKAYAMMCQAHPASNSFIRTKISIDGVDSAILYMKQNFISKEMNVLLSQPGLGGNTISQFCSFVISMVHKKSLKPSIPPPPISEPLDQDYKYFQAEDLDSVSCVQSRQIIPNRAPVAVIRQLTKTQAQVMISERSTPHAAEHDLIDSLALIQHLSCASELATTCQRLQGNRQVTLILGSTGAAKSTTANFLGGVPLEEVAHPDVPGEFVIQVRSGSASKTEIGHSLSTSSTLYPQVVEAWGDMVLADLPGFNDTRGSEFNIANVVNIKTFLKNCESGIRMLYLLEFSSLSNNRGNAVSNFAAQLKGLFPQFIDVAAACALVGLTKVPKDKTEANIEYWCRTFAELTSAAGFPIPATNVLVIDPLEIRPRCSRQELIAAITALPSLENPIEKYSPSLTALDHVSLQGMLSQIEHQVTEFVSRNQYDEAASYLEILTTINHLGFHQIQDCIHRLQHQITATLRGAVSDLRVEHQSTLRSIIEKNVKGRILQLHDARLLAAFCPEVLVILKDFAAHVQNSEDERRIANNARMASDADTIMENLRRDLKDLRVDDVQTCRSIGKIDLNGNASFILEALRAEHSHFKNAGSLRNLQIQIDKELSNRLHLQAYVGLFNPFVDSHKFAIDEIQGKISKFVCEDVVGMLKSIQKEAFLRELDELITKLSAQRDHAIAANAAATVLHENALYQHLVRNVTSSVFDPEKFFKQLGSYHFDVSTVSRTCEICKRINDCCPDGAKYTVLVSDFTSELSKKLVQCRRDELIRILASDSPNALTYIQASAHFAKQCELLRYGYDAHYDIYLTEIRRVVRDTFYERPCAHIQRLLQEPVDSSYKSAVTLAFESIDMVLRAAPDFFSEQDRIQRVQSKHSIEQKERQHWNSRGDQKRSTVDSIHRNLLSDLQCMAVDYGQVKGYLQGFPLHSTDGLALLQQLSHVLKDNANKLLNASRDFQSFIANSTDYVFPSFDRRFEQHLQQLQIDLKKELTAWLERAELKSFETSCKDKLNLMLAELKEIQRLCNDYHDKTHLGASGPAHSKCAIELDSKYRVTEAMVKRWDCGQFLTKRVPFVRLQDLECIPCLQSHFAVCSDMKTNHRFKDSAIQMLQNFERDFDIHGHHLAITKAVNYLPECKDVIPVHFRALKDLDAPEDLQRSCQTQLAAAIQKQQERSELGKKLENEDFASIVSLFVAISSIHREMGKLGVVIDYGAFERAVCDALNDLFKECCKQMHDFLTYRQSIDDKEQKTYVLRQASVFSKCFECFRRENLLKSFLDELEGRLAKIMEESLREVSQALGEKEFSVHAVLICKLMHARTLLASRGIECPCLNSDSVKRRCETMLRESKNVTQVSNHILTLQTHPVLGNASIEALREFPELRDVYRQLCNAKMSFMKFDDVIKQLQVGALSIGSPLQKMNLSPVSRGVLKTAFDACTSSFTQIVDSFIHGNSSPNFNMSALLDAVKGKMTELKPAIETVFSKRLSLGSKASEVGTFLGHLFGAWSICTDKSTVDKRCILQPHPAQIVCILMLLGIDENGPTRNQVMELLTGEGKSIVLGALATFFAYFGYNVDVVCYNPFLSQRDWNLFKFVFGFFAVADRIHYCDIDSLINRAMDTGAVPDLTEVAEAIAQQCVFKPSKLPSDPNKRILLIDEVDVFFGENFYGQRYNSVHVIDTPDTRELLCHVFEKRREYSGNPKKALKCLEKKDFVVRLRRNYPALDRFLPRQIELMIDDLKTFLQRDTNPYELDKDAQNVCYIDHKMSGKNTNQLLGYMTFWAYLYEVERGEIQYNPSVRKMGLQLFAGSILYSDLPKRYRLLLGLSGTVTELSEKDLEILANYQVSKCSFMPSTFRKTQLEVKHPQHVVTDPSIDGFFDAIKTAIQVELQPGHERTILVVFKDHETLTGFNVFLQNRPIHLRGAEPCVPGVLTDDISFCKRDASIKAAMFEGGVTLMTRSYGRGTDFICSSKVIDDRGGVHIIQTFLPLMISETKQIKGRTCRQDNKGSYREIFWAQDIDECKIASCDELRRWQSAPEERAKAAISLNLPVSDTLTVRDIIEKKRCDIDVARVEKMLESDRANSQQCRETEEMIKNQMAGNAPDALAMFEKFQNEWFGAACYTPSVHTVFILDESGSMFGEPWSNLQKSLTAYLNELSQQGSAEDRVSVIQFACDARIIREFISVSDAQSLVLEHMSGGTNFLPPLQKTRSLLQQDDSGYDVVIVFMTDGENNDDSDPMPVLQAIFSDCASRAQPVTLKFNAIAFGENPPSLRAMVDAVGDDGTYSHASDAIQLQQRFVEIARKMTLGSTRMQQSASPAYQSSTGSFSVTAAAAAPHQAIRSVSDVSVGDTVVLHNLIGNLRVFDGSDALVKRKTSQLEVEVISPPEAVLFSQGKHITIEPCNALLKQRSAAALTSPQDGAAASCAAAGGQAAPCEPPDELRDMYGTKAAIITLLNTKRIIAVHLSSDRDATRIQATV
jgi:uncharacterized protein YegL